MKVDMTLVNKTIENLKERQFDAVFVETAAEVLPLVKKMVPQGAVVANGGSVTLKQTGVIDWLGCGDFEYLSPAKDATAEEKKEMMRKRFFADVFFSSANAIVSDGRIVNEDGASTRVAPMIYGPDKVVIVAGVNKIVNTLGEANARVKKVAPVNCKNIGFDTPCVRDGKCHDCRHFQRSCCTSAVLNYSRVPDRITVVLVGEELGI